MSRYFEQTAGEQNIQGEDQQKLDVVADNQFIKMFEAGGKVCGIASEENDDFMPFESEFSKQGKYVVLFDPLDGSSINPPHGEVGINNGRI